MCQENYIMVNRIKGNVSKQRRWWDKENNVWRSFDTPKDRADYNKLMEGTGITEQIIMAHKTGNINTSTKDYNHKVKRKMVDTITHMYKNPERIPLLKLFE